MMPKLKITNDNTQNIIIQYE